jgi:Zn-dependent M28 family amino/carboxypeptidase
MKQLPSKIIGNAYRSGHAWTTLKELVDIGNRLAGQEGDERGIEVIESSFEQTGLDNISVNKFGIPGWWRGLSKLSIPVQDKTYERSHEIIALPGTPSKEVTAPLINVGYGRPKDFETTDIEGTICLVSSDTPNDFGRWIHRGEKYGMAIEQGAIGFVFRNHLEGCLPPTGNIGSDGPGKIPAVGISKELGDRLVRYTKKRKFELNLQLECRNSQTLSRNIEGTLGPDTKTEVVVSAHVDSHDIAEGARDNGAGSAVVCEVARMLSKIENHLDTKVRFLIFGAEEIGLFGSYHWVEHHEEDSLKCIINNDGLGRSRDLEVDTNTFSTISQAFEDASDNLGLDIDINEGISPNSDHWPFIQKGIPGARMGSKATVSGRGWGHTHGDTLDKIDPRDIRDSVIGLTASVLILASKEITIEHKEPKEIANAFDPSLKEGIQARGDWPFENVE